MKRIIIAMGIIIFAQLGLRADCGYGGGVEWIVNPMRYKGELCSIRFQVLQVINERTMLLEIEGDYALDREAIFYARLSPKMKFPSVIDGQRIWATGKITGTKTYATPAGSTKTVPLMVVRNITVLAY